MLVLPGGSSFLVHASLALSSSVWRAIRTQSRCNEQETHLCCVKLISFGDNFLQKNHFSSLRQGINLYTRCIWSKAWERDPGFWIQGSKAAYWLQRGGASGRSPYTTGAPQRLLGLEAPSCACVLSHFSCV